MRSLRSKNAPTQRALAAALALGLAASGAVVPFEAAATTHVVTNCLDSGFGSLRDTIAAATTLSGDVVDLSMPLACSTITLTSGAIHVDRNDLTLIGPSAITLTIDGGRLDRVIYHNGSGTLDITNLTITNGKYKSPNVYAKGGCIFSAANVILSNSHVSNCVITGQGSANAYGGGINTNGNLSLINSTISGSIVSSSSTYAFGGGAFVGGNFLAFASTIENNGAGTLGNGAYGGGLYTQGDAVVKQSTISGNNAAGAAGWSAWHRSFDGSRTTFISNSTISGNTASYGPGGLLAGNPLTLANSTVAFNQSGSGFGGGAVYSAGAALTLQSSIIADNVNRATGIPIDLGGEYGATISISGANNLITASTLPVPVDTINACPKLGPLQDNGGPTLTHALLHTSPAIDQGNNVSNLATDQRGPGFARTSGRGRTADIGAFEWQGTPDDGVFNSGFEVACDH